MRIGQVRKPMLKSTAYKRDECRCDAPTLTIDLANSSVVCGSCAKPARAALGGSDDRARVVYHVRHQRAEARLRELTQPEAPASRRKRAIALRRIEARRLRDEEGLTQSAIAERLGVSQRTIGLDLSDQLRAASAQRSANWRAANPERSREANKIYRQRNALDIRIARRERVASNREEVRQKQRDYRERNRERINAQARESYHRRKQERQRLPEVAL